MRWGRMTVAHGLHGESSRPPQEASVRCCSKHAMRPAGESTSTGWLPVQGLTHVGTNCSASYNGRVFKHMLQASRAMRLQACRGPSYLSTLRTLLLYSRRTGP